MTHHRSLLIEVHPDGSKAVGEHGGEEHEHLDCGDPVSKVGSVIDSVSTEFTPTIRYRSAVAPGTPVEGPPNDAHPVLAPVRIVEGRVQ